MFIRIRKFYFNTALITFPLTMLVLAFGFVFSSFIYNEYILEKTNYMCELYNSISSKISEIIIIDVTLSGFALTIYTFMISTYNENNKFTKFMDENNHYKRIRDITFILVVLNVVQTMFYVITSWTIAMFIVFIIIIGEFCALLYYIAFYKYKN